MDRKKPSECESSNVKLKVYYTPRENVVREDGGKQILKKRRSEEEMMEDRNRGRVESSCIHIKKFNFTSICATIFLRKSANQNIYKNSDDCKAVIKK